MDMKPLITGDANIGPMNAMQRKQSAAQATEKLARNLNPSKLKKIDESAKEFEAVFATEMMKPMFEGIKPDKEFGGGKGEEIFQGMMLDQYGKIMADRGGLGIADAVKAELIRLQAQKGQGQ
jgi:Rod binding domain-containing protein